MFYDHAFILQTTGAVKPRQAEPYTAVKPRQAEGLQEPYWRPIVHAQDTLLAKVESYSPSMARLQAPGEHTDGFIM